MIIKFKGETSLKQMGQMLPEIIKDTQQRAGIETADFLLKDVEIGVVFNIAGEKQFLAVEHEGLKETFTLVVQLDKQGNVVTKKDNEEETFMDKFERAVAKGEEVEYKEIESAYSDNDLVLETETYGGDMVCKTYRHIGTEEKVFRYYKNNILVGEFGCNEKRGA